MKEWILNGKSILAVDDEPDVLEVLEEEIREAGLNCTFDPGAEGRAFIHGSVGKCEC